MPRPCQRVRLESGLKLDINRLARNGFVHPGATSRPVGITWSDAYSGREIASGIISSDLRGPYEGWLWINIGDLRQKIHMVARRRHFGGHQWFFICPDTTRRAMVLWKPPGADHFASRQAWGRQVAYTSQFAAPIERAHLGKAKINSRLCSIGGFDPMSGICHQSRNGCVGIRTTARLRNSIDTTTSWIRGRVEPRSGY